MPRKPHQHAHKHGASIGMTRPSPDQAPPQPLVLGFDTSGTWIRAALLAGAHPLAQTDQPMARGQGEQLLPALEALLLEAGKTWASLDAIGVGTGPGNFTGIRISVATARGLALGLSIPAIGISRFEALALDGPALPRLLPAPRGMAWQQHPGHAPALVNPAMLDRTHIAEPGDFPATDTTPPAHPLAVAIARLAATRLRDATDIERPKPLYLRAADAAPARDTAPPLLD